MKFIKAFFFALLSFILNEYIFYYFTISFVVNFILLLIPLILAYRYGLSYALFLTLIFSVLLLGARPRELHLIPLETRGAFEYFSFHSQKLIFFSFSTTSLIIYSVLIVWRKKIILKLNNLIRVFIGLIVISGVVGIISNKILVQFIISDLKWVIAFLIGFNIKFSKEDIVQMRSHLEIVLYSTILLTLINVTNDFLIDDFKFKYSINFIYLIPIIGFFIIIRAKGSSLFLLNIPVTSTDIILYLGLLINKIKIKSLVTISVLALIGFTTYGISMSKVENDSFAGFLIRELKIDSDLTIDKSVVVRTYEFTNFSKGSVLNILLGRGIGGYFELNDFPLKLDLSDFSEFELRTRKFNHPHTFITYLLMKFGVIGFMLVIYYTFKYSYGSYIFRFVFTISILSAFYWVPLIAFIWGSYQSIIDNNEEISDFSRTIV